MKQTIQGILLAVLATLIWSGNFIVARAVIHDINPVSLAFLRWATAALLLLPFCLRAFRNEKAILIKNWKYFLWISMFGITLFNTFVYIAGHYSSAINLALIGTTSSPIFAIILAAIFLNEKIGLLKFLGLLLCISGILFLISKGDFGQLLAFRFSTGDLWILTAALCFAIYNTLVRKKPAGITSMNFLFVTFSFGTLLLLPFFITEQFILGPIDWTPGLLWIILYLGAGTSVIAFLCWNLAIARLGASRTALFGNLIPIFSALEAVILLGEQIRIVHLISGILVISGLILANLSMKTTKKTHE